MKRKNVLTWLGCSGSLTLALLTANSAQANTSNPSYREYVYTAPGAVEVPVAAENFFDSSLESDNWDCTCSNYDDTEQAEFEDREGDLAISTYGCDCAGCRNLVRNLLQKDAPRVN